MNTLSNYPNLSHFNWDIGKFVSSLNQMTKKDALDIILELSSELDEYLVSTVKADTDYLTENKVAITKFKLFLTNATKVVNHGTTDVGVVDREGDLMPYLKRLLDIIV